MATNEIKKTVDVRKLDSSTTMTITLNYTKEWKMRLWLAKGLIYFAVVVLGCSVEFEESEKESEE